MNVTNVCSTWGEGGEAEEAVAHFQLDNSYSTFCFAWPMYLKFRSVTSFLKLRDTKLRNLLYVCVCYRPPNFALWLACVQQHVMGQVLFCASFVLQSRTTI